MRGFALGEGHGGGPMDRLGGRFKDCTEFYASYHRAHVSGYGEERKDGHVVDLRRQRKAEYLLRVRLRKGGPISLKNLSLVRLPTVQFPGMEAPVSEKMIHLTFTTQQARVIAAVVELAKQFFAVPPNTAVYPNLGDFGMERDLMSAEIAATQETLLKQMVEQMPRE
jgi:hypothetical protein